MVAFVPLRFPLGMIFIINIVMFRRFFDSVDNDIFIVYRRYGVYLVVLSVYDYYLYGFLLYPDGVVRFGAYNIVINRNDEPSILFQYEGQLHSISIDNSVLLFPIQFRELFCFNV